MVDHNLLQRKKLFLFDLDGTLYLGDRLFEGVRELLSAIRARGGQYRFLTNNSSRSVEAYVEKFTRLGVATEAVDFLGRRADSLSPRARRRRPTLLRLRYGVDEITAPRGWLYRRRTA